MNRLWITNAFLFLGLVTTTARAQIQTHALVPSDAAPGSSVGSSASFSGDWIVLGGPSSPEASNGLGAIWFYQRQGSSWVQTQHVAPTPPLPLSNFGHKVAIDGDIAVASAPNATWGYGGAGRLYVFERSGSTWVQTAILGANDPLPGLSLGQSLAISGTRILAGAPQESHLGFVTGVAYVFEKVGGTWMQVAKLGASDAAGGQWFGYDVAIEGDTLAIGAKGAAGPSGNAQGAVYVFTRQGSTWIESQKLVHSLGTANDYMGFNVALSSDVIAAFAVTPTGRGAVYMFEQQGGTWVEGQRLIPLDPQASSDGFGSNVALDSGWLMVGQAGDDDQGSDTGAAYCFRKQSGQWIQAGKLLPVSIVAPDRFGAVTAISGGYALITDPYTDEACPSSISCNTGSAYVFALPIDGMQFGSCWVSAPCGNVTTHGGCTNSTGKPALLASAGTGSVTADDLLIEALQVPPNVFGIYFMGGGQTSTPLGDGLRVAASVSGSGLYRFGAQQVGPDGRALLGPGIVTHSQLFPPAGQIQAGTTWNFQFWYRDVSGPCGNATNVTNGVSVTFTP
jgi:hypothetical protein